MKKMVFQFLLIVCLVPLSVFGQSRYSFLLHKTYAQRFRQLDSLFYDETQKFKDSAGFFKAADDLAFLAEKEGDNELFLEAQFIKWRFYPYSPLRSDYSYLESKLAFLLREAEQKNMTHLEARIEDNLGLFYHKFGKISRSVEEYLSGYYLLKNIPLEEFPGKRDFIYYDLAATYFSLGDYENAKKFLVEADSLPVYATPRFRKMRALIDMTNTLGLIYRNASRWDSAEYFLYKAYHIAEKERDSAWIGIAGGNIGITYFLQKKYQEAIPLLEKDVELSTRAEEYHNAANSLIKLAEITLVYNNKKKAFQQLLQARALTSITYGQFKLLADLFPLMSRFYADEGNLTLAYRYADSANIMKDSIFLQTDKIALARAQQKADMEHHLAEVQQLENQQKIKTLQRNSLLYVVALMILITILLINRQRLLKKEKLYAEGQEEQAIKELTTAKQQLDDFTVNIREKNELVEKLTSEMNQLQAVFGKEAADQRSATIEQLRQATILTEDQWDSFRGTFEKAYPAYFSRLQHKLPGLSAADLRFLTLSKLKLSAKEMGAILGISPGSIRMSRHRLRRKYNIPDEESFELLADSI